MKPDTTLFFITTLFAASLVPACRHGDPEPEDFASMQMNATLVPRSPTNAHADDPAARALGRTLFFDAGLSSDGTIACVTCHDPSNGFSDPRPRSVGVRGQLGDRHSMPVTAAVFHPFLLWDGKADAAWSQPLKALENPKEMDLSRVEVARRVASTHAASYVEAFGPLPDLSSLPARAMPGTPEWSEMPTERRGDVDRVFANVGKAIEAYERQLLCADTRFDRWVRGQEQLTSAELDGAATFLRQGCDGCHSGPSLSDGGFHDIGLPSPDLGRATGASALLDDPFNGAGALSDDPVAGAARLAVVATETAREGSFRTASLRGVGQRTFFGHAAHQQTLRGFLLDVYGRRRRDRAATVGTLDPRLSRVDVDGGDVDDLVAFLRTLDCPPLEPSLAAP